MKWSWADFLIRLVATMIAALALSFLTDYFMEREHVASVVEPDIVTHGQPTAHQRPDFTRPAMVIGGVTTVLLLALLGGWKRWNLKMVTAITVIVASLYGTPSLGILSVIFTTLFYLGSAKAHDVVYYYLAPATHSSPESESEMH